MSAIFEIAAEKSYVNEGGISNRSNDYGGLTNGGISKRAYPTLNISTLTKENIFVIYKRDYWDFNHLSELHDQGIADQIFDMFLNTKPLSAATAVQLAIRACGGQIIIDGRMGGNTIAACNALDPVLFIAKFRLERIRFYLGRVDANPEQIGNLRDWLRRSLK